MHATFNLTQIVKKKSMRWGMQRDFHYKAFLSYSHKDQKVAQWLHKRLERYRLPQHLFSEVSNHIEASGSLGRIFRDRDELPVADDLTAEVRKALASSEFMIVLCSPNAAASRWVNKEVIEFKRLRGEANVLPIVIDGIPLANEADNASECFPPGLKFKLGPDGTLSKVLAEPIAADIRKKADGKIRAVQKLIAGLLGLGLDRLVERELQRKQRRVMVITALSVIAMLFMGALTYQAVVARQEAEFQRGQAEDLVEFMLTDLREKLVPVGRLDVLDAVGDKAVAYYGSEALEDLQDDSVGRRARAFHLLGEIEKEKDNAVKARRLFQQAMDATADLLARDPNNAQRIYEHAQSVFWMGYLDMEQGAHAMAEEAFREYKEYGEQLVAMDPTNPEWQMELAWGYYNIGAVQEQSLQQPRKALKNFDMQNEVLQELLNQDPNSEFYLTELSDNLAWRSDAKSNFSPVDEVLALRGEQRKILQKLQTIDPLNKSLVYASMQSHRASGHMKLFSGEYEDALVFYQKAEELAASLVKTDPDNITRAIMLLQVRLNIAFAHVRQGEIANAARIMLEREPDIRRLLLSSDSTTELVVLQKIIAALINIEIAHQISPSDEALEMCNALEQLILGQGKAVLDAADFQMYLGNFYLVKAKILGAIGRSAEADLLLVKFWQGLSPAGDLNTGIDQHPRNLRPLMMIAQWVGDSEFEKRIKEVLMQRGFEIPGNS